MQKYIGAVLATAAVLGFLFWADGRGFSRLGNTASSTRLNFPLLPETFKFPTLDGTPVGLEAWGVWREYLEAAKAHDLEKVKALSYQLSTACSDPNKKTECEELMDSAYFFGNGFKQGDFNNIVYDNKQIVLSTNYMNIEGVEDPTKIVLYFVRTASGPKVLGLRFCFGVEGEGDECVETSREKRDQDRDGWWGDVEVLFK